MSYLDNKKFVLALALLLVVTGSGVAMWTQTAGGSVETRHVRFATADGSMMDATLYVPDDVSAQEPAPGIVATHGYINSKETQSPFAIEFARRGFVVLAIDQTGHGYSDSPAFSAGFGGPPALEYMQSLAFVDEENIGLEGHSMGGWASVAAAGSAPDGYESIVLEGSSTGTFGVPAGNETFPRNMAVVFSEYDEFSMLMWGVPHASDVEHSEKLQTAFGVDSTIQEGRTYGNIEDGTARRLYTPATTHPGDHLSPTAVGDSIEWMQLTLDGEDEMPPGNQIWFFKELGTLVAMLGGVLALFPLGGAVLDRREFTDVVGGEPTVAGATGTGWYVAAVVATLVPVVTYIPLMLVGQGFVPLTWLTPQQITNGVAVWALGNTLITGGLLAVWHRTRNADADPAAYGLDRGSGIEPLGKSLAVAAVVVGGFYLLLGAVGAVFGTDFRFWVIAMKFPSTTQFRVALGYLPVFVALFVALGALLHGQLRREGVSLRREAATNVLVVTGGFIAFLAVQYATLLSGSPLPFGQPLLTIVAIQFVVLLAIVALVSTYFFRRTNRIWIGAFVNALFVTLVVVAGTATHFPL